VVERTVPRHGLEKDGTLTLGWIDQGALWWNLALDAVITVHASGQVTVDPSARSGRGLRRRDASVHRAGAAAGGGLRGA
jgi:hypothetical protein